MKYEDEINVGWIILCHNGKLLNLLVGQFFCGSDLNLYSCKRLGFFFEFSPLFSVWTFW